MIRRVTLDDFAELFAVAEESYKVPWDRMAMYNWGVLAITRPDTIAIRDDDAFGLAQVAGAPWLPTELHGSQLLLAMRPTAVWQGMKVMRTMIRWCMDEMGAVDYHFGEATNMRMDIFAKRLGAVPNSPTFVCRRGT